MNMLNPRGRFFLVGALRTGSSLLARCVDDHPGAICLCESEINRALFGDYAISYHCERMGVHGFSMPDTLAYLDHRKQDDIPSLESWYDAIHPRLLEEFRKPAGSMLGDKSPDFYRSPELVRHLVQNHRLIYTTRDPRAIFASIYAQQESSIEEKGDRWAALVGNYLAWRPYLGSRNLLVIRYEDLVRMPRFTMKRVYDHLGLADSARFFEAFPRLHPYRFLWNTAIDWETGIRRDFDIHRISAWTLKLTDSLIDFIRSDEAVRQFMVQFGYD